MAEEMPLMGSASSSRTMNRPIAAVAALCAVFLAGEAPRFWGHRRSDGGVGCFAQLDALVA